MQRSIARVVTTVGQKMVANLEAHLVCTYTGGEAPPAVLELISQVGSKARHQLALIEREISLFVRERRTARVRRGSGVAFRPFLWCVVDPRRVAADSDAFLQSTDRERQGGARRRAA